MISKKTWVKVIRKYKKSLVKTRLLEGKTKLYAFFLLFLSFVEPDNKTC